MTRHFRPGCPSVWLLTVLFWGPQSAGAAFERQVTGGRSAGMGSAIVTGSPDVWSAGVHSALLGLLDRPSFESQIQPSPFGLSELSRAGIAAALQLGPGTVALSGMRFGGELYQETEVALAAGFRLHPMLLLGVRLRWCHLSIDRYGSASTVALDASVAVAPAAGLIIATMVQGLNRPSVGECGEKLPLAFTMGISYRPAGPMELVVELQHDVLFDPGLNAGIEYMITDFIRVRSGLAGGVRSWTFGVGLRHRGLLCDYGLMLHPILGPSHVVGFGFGFE